MPVSLIAFCPLLAAASVQDFPHFPHHRLRLHHLRPSIEPMSGAAVALWLTRHADELPSYAISELSLLLLFQALILTYLIMFILIFIVVLFNSKTLLLSWAGLAGSFLLLSAELSLPVPFQLLIDLLLPLHWLINFCLSLLILAKLISYEISILLLLGWFILFH